MESVVNGYAEGIALDPAGFLSEGSGQNLFLVRDGMLTTPPLASSALAGITRDCVITLAHDLGIPVREELQPREALYLADELFFTGTAAEITPIRSVDRITIGAGDRGPVTETIQQRFFDVIHGREPDAHGWLTYVYPNTEAKKAAKDTAPSYG
jgi:branched-chain amino acid aminotransferase